MICGGAVELASMTIQLDGYRVITGVCRRRSHGLAGELRLVSRSHVALHHSPVSNPADHLVPDSGHKFSCTNKVQEAASLRDLDVTADEGYARHVCRKRTDTRRTRELVKVGCRPCLACAGALISQMQTCGGAALTHTGLPRVKQSYWTFLGRAVLLNALAAVRLVIAQVIAARALCIEYCTRVVVAFA